MRSVMHIQCGFVAGALALGALGGCSSGGKVLATVGDDKITADEFQTSMATLPPQWQARAKTPSGRKQILEHQVRQKLIELEAEDRAIDERPEVAYQIDQAVQRILLQELMKDWQKDFQIPDDELRDYFEKHKAEFVSPEQFRAQQVLVKVGEKDTPAKAEAARKKAAEARARIAKGEPFEKIAKEYGDGPSADKGGDLGYVKRGHYHPKVEEAAMALKPGELSQPVRSPFGWHVLKLIDVKAASEPAFDEVKDKISKKLAPRKRQEAFEGFMESLKKKYDVTVDEEALAAVVVEEKSDEAKGADKAKQPDAQPAPAK